MEWVGVGLATVVALALPVAGVLLIGALLRRRSALPPDLGMSPQDEAELVHAFQSVDRELGAAREKLLAARLEVLRRRQVPARGVRQVPGADAARLAFADGTVLIVRARKAGDLYVMAVSLVEHPVCVRDVRHEEGNTVVQMVWPPHGHLELQVLGLDQAD